MIDFSQLHFIRPLAWTLLPVILLTGWWFIRNKAQTIEWKNYLDEHLANWLLDSAKKQSKKSYLWPIVFILCSVLVSFAAAGPAWEKQPVAISQATTKAIILLDLSPSMTVEDIKPSRLARAKFKILEILKKWQQGYVGLVAYADDGFVISPLTDDAETIANMVNILSPEVMPAEGSSADRGVSKSLELLKQSDEITISGDILLITDGISQHRISKITTMLSETQVRLSVLAIGTEQGAPIQSQLNTGFVTGNDGAIVIAKLNKRPLIELTKPSNGLFLSSKASNNDILSWLKLIDNESKTEFDQLADKKIEKWVDQGALFLLPVILLVAFIFRKGLLFSLLIISFSMPLDNLYAASPSATKSKQTSTKDSIKPSDLEDSLWDSIWYNNGQLGDRKMQANHPQLALQNYTKPEKIADALYRAGLYQQAAEVYGSISGAKARYNEGNALAQAKQFEQAISSYQQAIKQKPDFEEAKKNLQTVQKLLEQQKQQNQDNQQDKDNPQDKDKENNQGENKDNNKDNQQKSDESEKNQNQDKQDTDSSDSDPSQDSDQDKPPQQNKPEKNDQQTDQQKQQQKQNKQNQDQKKQNKQEMTAEEIEAEKQKQQMIEQWLRQIKDDPSGLLRNKLILEQRKRELSGKKSKPGEKEW